MVGNDVGYSGCLQFAFSYGCQCETVLYKPPFGLWSKLPVSLLMTPIVVPYLMPYITTLRSLDYGLFGVRSGEVLVICSVNSH